jgi:hypothetical protein
MRQAYVQGAWAYAKGMELHWKRWGFELEDVGFLGIRLWYGKQNEGGPAEMVKHMAIRLEGAVYGAHEGESQYIMFRETRAMLKDLIGATNS